MKKPLVILYLLLINAVCFAQNSLLGTVRDANTRELIGWANVSLRLPNSDTPILGTSTDSEGEFVLAGMPNGTYTISVSFMGYITLERTVILQGQRVDLGILYLKEDTQTLEEVEVIGQGSTMRFELDKKVFSVDQTIAASGGSVTDALEQIPSVDVDQDGNIALRNSDAVEVWINGKPAGLTADNRADVLKQMPAGSIKEIEVITNPSAKYSPEGTAGIINLVTKKDRKSGYYGSLNLNVDYCLAAPWNVPPGGRAGFNINFNHRIVEGYLNAGYHYHTSNGANQSDRYSFNMIDTTRLIREGNRTHQGGGMFLRGGLDFHVTERSTIGVSAFGMLSLKNDPTQGGFSSVGSSPTWYEQYDVMNLIDYQSNDNVEQLTRLYRRDEMSRGSHPGWNGMIDWHFAISKSHDLRISARYADFGFNQLNYYMQQDYSIDGNRTAQGTEQIQEQIAESNDRSVQLKADYEWKPTMQSRLEAGWQTDLAWRTTNADAYNCIADSYMRQQQLIAYYNLFANNEQTHALYITYGNRFFDNRFAIQAGLRGEYFIRHLSSEYYDLLADKTVAEQDTTYFQLFPSIYLSYSYDNGHEIQLNYTRRIDRPRGHQINPRQNFEDSTNITYGNPGLMPSFSSAVELNYLKNWDRHVLSAGLFYRFQEDITQKISYIDTDLMRSTWTNLGRQHSAGMEISVKNKFFGELLQLNTSAEFYYNRIDSAAYTPIVNGKGMEPVIIHPHNIFAGGVRISASFMFTKTFTGQISGRYRSPRVLAQGRTSHNYSIDLGLRKTFFDRRMALALNVRDLLNSRARQSYSYGDGFWQYSRNRWNSRSISLSIIYNFGNTQPTRNEAFKDNHSRSDSSMFEESGPDE